MLMLASLDRFLNSKPAHVVFFLDLRPDVRPRWRQEITDGSEVEENRKADAMNIGKSSSWAGSKFKQCMGWFTKTLRPKFLPAWQCR